MKNWTKPLRGMRACTDALEWCEGYKSLAEAWDECKRGDWMLWLLGKLSGESESPERKKVVLAACQCARLALPHVKAGELRPLKAIETAEAWARGEDNITLKDVRKAAAYAADSVAYAASAAYYAAAYAADAAAAAASAASADDASAAAASAADAAYYAAYANTDTYAADARLLVLDKCADIVRKHYPVAPAL